MVSITSPTTATKSSVSKRRNISASSVYGRVGLIMKSSLSDELFGRSRQRPARRCSQRGGVLHQGAHIAHREGLSGMPGRIAGHFGRMVRDQDPVVVFVTQDTNDLG